MTPAEEQISMNELANMMKSSFVEVKDGIMTLNDKFTINVEKIDKLNESMSKVSKKVETVSSENKSISDSVNKNKSDIDELIRQQNKFNSKYEEIIHWPTND